MVRWLVKKLLGDFKKEITKKMWQSNTTRTVAISSVTGIAICRAICAALAELGLIPEGMVEETALVMSAVIIPLLSRLIAIIRSKL